MHTHLFKRHPIYLTIAVSIAAQAQATEEKPLTLAPVVVTATRNAQNSFDLPIAIDVVGQQDIQEAQLQMSLSESLIRVPGITAQSRSQQAQDPQISSRGFGARSSFGVRGIRLYVDGIPLTMPDGQGQPGVVDLSAIKNIEVMRGPFSSLYGSASGGVIQLLTEKPPSTPTVGATTMYGSDHTTRQVLDAAGQAEGIAYLLNLSNFTSDGYRDHSKSDKQMATAKFKIHISEDTKLTTLVNWFEQEAEDPLGLPRVATANDPSAFDNPKAVPKSALRANTRVSRNHAQIGFNLEHTFDENNSINLINYVGNRENLQYLSTNASNAVGRASQISREFWGSDLRWNNKGEVFGKHYTLQLGMNYGQSSDARLDINTDNGVKRNTNVPNNANSARNRDENNVVRNFDQYMQGSLAATDTIDFHAGVRKTRVRLEVDDHFIAGLGNNGNNSGAVTYEKTNPVMGVLWKVTPALNLYANYGKGFETPTFIEAAYNSTGSNAIPNLGLRPSKSDNYELGAKAYIGDATLLNLSIFLTNTQDELVISQNLNGRAVYTNANDTRRTGAELSLSTQYAHDLSTYIAYSLLNAQYTSSYSGVNGLIASGNTIPGTYRNQLYAEVAWKYPALGFYTALEGRYNSKVYVDDINSDAASAYTIFNLRAGFEQRYAHWQLKEYVRIENMFDREYIGSVRVNDTNSRYFEPAAGRNYLLGLSAQYKF